MNNACAPRALSLKACQDLALIKVVLAVNTGNKSQIDKLLDEFKDVFIGQGCVSGEYTMQLKPEVQ